MAGKKVFLLDTMSFVYRAYHAAAHQKNIVMSTKAGFPTGATYIFARMLKKLMDEHKPEYLIACMEGGGESFREKLFPEYKANRKGETPYDLQRQIPFMHQLMDAYKLPKYNFVGYEADDIIGTLSRQYYEEDPENQIFIVTGDKDMFQLVNDRTFTLNPMKDLLADAQKVELIVGVPPYQVTDVMALRGDTVDNIPGAPGIGDKGSISIIKEFGSLTAALDRAGEIKRKSYRESLQNNRAQIELSKQLVTIDCNVPVKFDAEQSKLPAPDEALLTSLYTQLEFSSLLKKEELAAVDGFAEIAPPTETATATTMTDDQAQLALDSIL